MREQELRSPDQVPHGQRADAEATSPLHQLICQMRRLPTLSEVPLRVLQLLEDPEFSLDEVAGWISRDPVLASRIVGMASSPLFGPGRRTSSVDAAVLQLGQLETRAAVLAIGVMSALPELPAPLSHDRFWAFALGSARCARQLADDLGYPGREEAYMGGLVHRLGEVFLAASFPERYTAAWHRACETGRDLDRCLLDEFGVSHTELCAHVLRDWGLPTEIASAVRDSPAPEESSETPILALILWTSTWLCREFGIGHRCPLSERHRWNDHLPESIEAELHELGYSSLVSFLLRRPDFAREMARLAGHLSGQV
jgi:HD-like signal output (HDOD) protein